MLLVTECSEIRSAARTPSSLLEVGARELVIPTRDLLTVG
jgi:hypothetical protein